MIRSIIALLATTLISLCYIGMTSTAAQAHTNWKPCKYEDGSGQSRCIWDARHMGNGFGDSLIIRKGGTDEMKVKVISHRRAHRLLNNHC